MKYVTKVAIFVSLIFIAFSGWANSIFLENILRNAALENGYKIPEEINSKFDEKLADVGQKFFETTKLSLNGNTSCSSCHIDRFSSGDGIPNAIGVGGHGEGIIRLNSGGALVPRNTLPLWGRAATGFDTFFWDGKVEALNGKLISQFGSENPTPDPLEVAIHLPFVEIREMIVDTEDINSRFKNENVISAEDIQKELATRIRNDDDLGAKLALAHGIDRNDISFQHITSSIRHFFADKFKLRETKFSDFISGKGHLSREEINGGILFYGKGRCSSCHSGPHFSDFGFHNIIFPQAGPGKNGFGVDYGRFNVTFKPSDLYRFRTPPLHNVEQTFPYGHSGSLSKLEEAIIAHYDPLSLFEMEKLTLENRREIYSRMVSTPYSQTVPSTLNNDELSDLISFLKTISFKED